MIMNNSADDRWMLSEDKLQVTAVETFFSLAAVLGEKIPMNLHDVPFHQQKHSMQM